MIIAVGKHTWGGSASFGSSKHLGHSFHVSEGCDRDGQNWGRTFGYVTIDEHPYHLVPICPENVILEGVTYRGEKIVSREPVYPSSALRSLLERYEAQLQPAIDGGLYDDMIGAKWNIVQSLLADFDKEFGA